MSDWPLYVAAGFGHVEVVKLLYEVCIAVLDTVCTVPLDEF